MSNVYAKEPSNLRLYSSIDFTNVPLSKLDMRRARRSNAVYCSTSMNVRPEATRRLSPMQNYQSGEAPKTRLENKIDLPFSSKQLLKEFTDKVNSRANKYSNLKDVANRNNEKLRENFNNTYQYSPRTKVLNGMPSYEGSVRSSSIDRGIAHVPKPKKEILIQTNRTENNTTRHITPLRPVKENKTIKLKNFK